MIIRITRPLQAALIGFIAAAVLAGAPAARAADLEVGQPAPGFSVPDETGRVRTLDEFKGKTLILAFYPKDFTGG
jgi:peroxiredoxin Q/BCP